MARAARQSCDLVFKHSLPRAITIARSGLAPLLGLRRSFHFSPSHRPYVPTHRPRTLAARRRLRARPHPPKARSCGPHRRGYCSDHLSIPAGAARDRRHGMGSLAAGVSRPPAGLGFKPVSSAFPRAKFALHPFRTDQLRIANDDIGGADNVVIRDVLSALRAPMAVEGGGARTVGLVPQLQLKVRQAKVGLFHDLPLRRWSVVREAVRTISEPC